MFKDLKIIFKAWKILKPFHKWIKIFFFLQILNQIISIGIIYFIGNVFTKLISKDVKSIIYLISYILILKIIEIIIGFIEGKIQLYKLGKNLTQYVEEKTLRNIFNLNTAQILEEHSLFRLNVINKGENALVNSVYLLLFNLLKPILFLFISAIILFFFSWKIALIFLILMLVCFIWINKFQKYFIPFRKKDNDNWDNQAKNRSEIYQHLILVKNFATEDKSIFLYLKNRLDFVSYHSFIWNKNLSHYTKRQSFISISNLFIYSFSIFLYLTDKILIGNVYTISTLSNYIFGYISQISFSMRELSTYLPQIEKYFDLLNVKPIFNESGKILEKIQDIEFKNVYFKYPKHDKYILEDISFSIPSGKKIAFVGESGSGKSTIVKLLMRIYDYEKGNILINQEELKNLDVKNLKQKTGYVEQQVDLFDEALRKNILLGINEKDIKKEEEEKELEKIAKLSRIDQFYHRLGEKKFETILGEKGIKLSGGERQRVGIARAIIKNPDLLIFDEATSSLDTENESEVVRAIDEVSKNKTTIIIAHRLSTVVNCDIIFVMSKGKIVDKGDYEYLSKNSEIFKNLIKHQMI